MCIVEMDPKSRLEKLTKQAEEISIDLSIPSKRYVRSCIEIARMGDTYYSELNYEHAYVLYMKFLVLTLEKLRNHPDFRFLPHGDLQKCKDLAKDIFPKVEKLKELLNKQFEEEYLRWYENEDKKLEAEREMKRQEEEKIRRREQEKRDAKGNVKLPPTPPTLPYNSLIIEPVKIPDNIIYDEPEKGLPSESMQAMTGLSESDRDLNWSNDKGEEKVKKLVAGAKPDVNRALKPSTGPLTAEQNENSNTLGLKSLWIPNSLINRFIDIAEKNTLRNIETCGVLAGKLGFGKFVCSHLIIPEQTGTSDSCVTLKEENIFEVQDKNQLLTLGWIHTHPTQSCFLSSVDLHTQCSYQLLMPEAVALVCAIKCDELGCFRLTDLGIQEVAKCQLSGFHYHSNNPPTYLEATNVKFDPDIPLFVIDLRK